MKLSARASTVRGPLAVPKRPPLPMLKMPLHPASVPETALVSQQTLEDSLSTVCGPLCDAKQAAAVNLQDATPFCRC